MILFRLLTLPVRMAAGSARVGFQAGRAVGVRRSVVFGAGVGTGVLIASPDARKAAARGLLTLQAAIAKARRPSDAELAAAVRAELGRAQRTWHLPQPQVEVHDGRVVLRGAVPHEAGRRDLAATAAAVDGVVEVDNQVGVT
jgi:osmotically-inducible protein OsmY